MCVVLTTGDGSNGSFLKFKNAGCVVSPKEDTIIEERLYKSAVYGFKYRFGNDAFEAIHSSDRDSNFTGYFLNVVIPC